MEKYTYIIVRKYSKNGYVHENTEKYSYIIGEKYSKDEYEDMEKYAYTIAQKIFEWYFWVCVWKYIIQNIRKNIYERISNIRRIYEIIKDL